MSNKNESMKMQNDEQMHNPLTQQQEQQQRGAAGNQNFGGGNVNAKTAQQSVSSQQQQQQKHADKSSGNCDCRGSCASGQSGSSGGDRKACGCDDGGCACNANTQRYPFSK